MQFKHPELLYALLALLIPILIHLFQLRKFKKQSFTNVAFLKKVTSQTRKSSQLKKWLILCTRMLLLAALIIAFAQPFTSKTNKLNTKKESVIYLDNSFSMQANGQEGELLKRAVQDVIKNVNETEELTLFTNNHTFKNTTIGAIKNELLQLDYTSNQLNYDALLLKAKNLFNNNSGHLKQLILISDFQTKETRFNPILDSLMSIHAVQLKPVNTNNFSVDSLYVSNKTPLNIELTAIISNQGTAIENVPVSLFSNDNLIAKTVIDVEKDTPANFTINNEEKIIGEIVIDDDNLNFDNTLYFNINKPNKTKVLVINENDDRFLKRIFTEEEFFFTSEALSNLNYSDIENQNLIVLNELEDIPNSLSTALKAFSEKGGFIVIIPSVKSNLQNYNNFLLPYNMRFDKLNTSEKRITTINYSHPLYKDVFNKQVSNFQYPKAESYYPVLSQNSTTPLKFEDGKAFLSKSGQVYVFSASLKTENSNFKNSPLIVPTFYNIGKQSLKTSNLYYTIGEENTFDISVTLQQDDILTLSLGEESMIPQQQYFNNKVQVTTTETPTRAGTYHVNNKTELIENISFNYKRDESILQYQDLSAIKNIHVAQSVSNLFDTLKSDSKINELWKWFVIFALGFLAIEMLILKYFK
ncbi:vWA domain-containing protein [Xanthomarina sp. F2636L]|uniref:vWA domain-containing protein n=1 Tax=Xanthomarina sp. F2636L TaxID=2996018 RepID=UPI00225E66F1|nr:BatA and WFA domain-containing protein [Xanthomarina sp. F2636L]MCX7549745.1 BatA and WFA domain-containing protein [Xanthomarina sp. F2636L]